MGPLASNATTCFYKRTGLYPLNVRASSWKEAEETIGLACVLASESVVAKKTWEVRVKKAAAGLLTQEENTLKEYLPSDGAERHILVHGKVIMDSILKHWSLQVKELEKQGKWTEAFQLETPHELIAEKLFEFERPDVDAIPPPSQRRRQGKNRKKIRK
eukprot:scaffold43944_cov59-Attheya_sp.AAC.10